MPVATLSRWTMAFFAAALLMLAVAEAFMVAGIGYPAAGLLAPESLIVVHVVVIGWLSLAMAGALLQFVPVLVLHPLVFSQFALPALSVLTGGLILLVAGFSTLAGWTTWSLDLLPLGGLLLAAGFAMLVIILGATVVVGGFGQPFARFVLLGLICLSGTVASGLAFTFVLAGRSDWLASANLLPAGVPFHALLGVGGWLGVTAFGVAYRLFSMFLLAPDPSRRRVLAVLVTAAAALLAIGVGLAALLAGLEPGDLLLMLAVSGLAVAAALHGRDIFTLYRARHRKGLEINMRSSIGATAALMLGMALLPPAVIFGAAESVVVALAFLLVFGWLSGLTLAQLVKIVSFMTWLEAYGELIGRVRTPQVSDLVPMPRTAAWLVLHFAGVAAGALALAAGAAGTFRLAMLVCLAGTIGLIAELVRVRRLCQVEPVRRPPADARPRIFLPPRSHRRQADGPFPAVRSSGRPRA